jgi:ribosomal protein RSM22 (predicted rRNA methylase)
MIPPMALPTALQDGIDELVRDVDGRELERAARSLSEGYRAGGAAASRAAGTGAEVAAYLATRAPATYAAADDVCRRVAAARPEWQPRSLLDLGAGPGIAAWAAVDTWPGLEELTLVEAEPGMAAAGRALARRGSDALRRARWFERDATAPGDEADLVIVSYVLGELAPGTLGNAIDRFWGSATDTLIVVEPGTTAGYERILAVRDHAIRAGGTVLAPCPHDAACPLPPGDWCHFSVRLPRTRTHRTAKAAERGFEDEKLAYVVLARNPHARAGARILRRPELHGGHVVLDLCTTQGLERRTVSKRDGTSYKQARKAGWGDALL